MSIMGTESSPPSPPVATSQPWLDAELRRLGLPLDVPVRVQFIRYEALLLEWNERTSLTADATPERLQLRHFGESLALLVALRGAALIERDTELVDVGSGGGFPGLPLRIAERSLRVTLLEASARRCRFLRTAIAALDLDDVAVVQARAEDAGRDQELRGHFALAVARAVAPLAVLVEYALPLLCSGGLLAAPKGSRGPSELAAASVAIEALGGSVEPAIALSLPDGVPPQQVFLVRRTGPLDERYPRRAGIPSKRPLHQR